MDVDNAYKTMVAYLESNINDAMKAVYKQHNIMAHRSDSRNIVKPYIELQLLYNTRMNKCYIEWDIDAKLRSILNYSEMKRQFDATVNTNLHRNTGIWPSIINGEDFKIGRNKVILSSSKDKEIEMAAYDAITNLKNELANHKGYQDLPEKTKNLYLKEMNDAYAQSATLTPRELRELIAEINTRYNITNFYNVANNINKQDYYSDMRNGGSNSRGYESITPVSNDIFEDVSETITPYTIGYIHSIYGRDLFIEDKIEFELDSRNAFKVPSVGSVKPDLTFEDWSKDVKELADQKLSINSTWIAYKELYNVYFDKQLSDLHDEARIYFLEVDY